AFATSTELPRKYGATDTADRALMALQPMAGLDMLEFEAFADQGGPAHLFVPLDWMRRELERRGHRLRPVARCRLGTLYRLVRTGLPRGREAGLARVGLP